METECLTVPPSHELQRHLRGSRGREQLGILLEQLHLIWSTVADHDSEAQRPPSGCASE